MIWNNLIEKISSLTQIGTVNLLDKNKSKKVPV